MDGKFFGHAERIAGIAFKEGLDANTLLEAVDFRYGEMNCFPGLFSPCRCETAIFVSITGGSTRKKWRFNFEQMLQEVVRHMQGKFSETTRNIGIITDSWIAPSFERWESNLRAISRSAHLEIYMIGHPCWVVQVQI